MTSSAVAARADQSSLIVRSVAEPGSLCQVTHSLAFRAVRCLLDLGAVTMAWYLTALVRPALNPWMPQNLSVHLMQLAAPPLPALLILWALSSSLLGLYSDRGFGNIQAIFVSICKSVALTSVQALAIIAFSREFGVDRSRSFVPLFALVSLALLGLSSYLALALAWLFETHWPSLNGVAVIGRGREAETVVGSIRKSHYGPLAFKGVILPARNAFLGPDEHARTLGTTDRLAEVINRERLSHIIVADHGLTEQDFQSYCRTAREMGVTMSRPLLAPDFRQVTHFGLDLIALRPEKDERGQEAIKRGFDIALAAGGLLLLSPVLVLSMLAVKLTSKGPIFYKSVRVGRGGRYFTFWKFRSMWVHADRAPIRNQNEKAGHIFKVKHDPRITKVGQFLRRYSLDEIPQLFNVLLGDMSIVGPRPLPSEDMDPDGKSREYRVWAEERARVRPGITGLWQISGRSDLDFSQMVDLDIHYVRNWSFLHDLKILWHTPRVVLFGRGAY